MAGAWKLEIGDDRVAWLTFDLSGEKVNKLNAASMIELSITLESLRQLKELRGLVIRSGKPDGFIAGADINELAAIATIEEAREKAELGRAVFNRLEGLRYPTVAMIHGPCLGGGLELALACRYRVVSDHDRTTLGLPEVSLGIIPGWGGTQRLPRVVGISAAATMILTGKPVPARKAVSMGLADAIAAEPFLADAARRLIETVQGRGGRRAVLRRRRRSGGLGRRLAATPVGRAFVLRMARRQTLARTRGHYPAPLAAIEVLRYRRGAAAETEAFARLAVSQVSRNLVWLFQASQRIKRQAPQGAGQRESPRAAVVGAGIMGSGIAWALAKAGIPVRLRDVNWEALARGMSAAAGMCRALVKRRQMTPSEMDVVMLRIGPGTDYSGFQNASIVIEAVSEDMGLKKKVLQEIESRVRPDAIICSNTSSLPLEELAAALTHPERFIGLHFFNPVNRMPLVEVVPWRGTDRAVIVAAADMVRKMDKTALVVGDCAGFLVNRILLPYLIESAWMFEEGTNPQRIDAALEGFGMPMGPLALVDEVGLDVGYKVAMLLEGAYGSRMHVPKALGTIASLPGCTGRKAGVGFYRYRGERRRVNKKVLAVAQQARKSDNVQARSLSDDEIVDRAVLIMVNEAARCLEEGIVAGPEALDMAMVMGTGFAPFRGGLLRYADERGVAAVRTRLDELAQRFGERFLAAPLLARIAENGGRFYKDAA
jgi:3-hydroxyacyl-CoA dehydrogenase/enoyl-CoA hydratase/3-hydroxybutyryl-CoA epimerase